MYSYPLFQVSASTPRRHSVSNVSLKLNRIDRFKQLKTWEKKLSLLLHDDSFNESLETVTNLGTEICPTKASVVYSGMTWTVHSRISLPVPDDKMIIKMPIVSRRDLQVNAASGLSQEFQCSNPWIFSECMACAESGLDSKQGPSDVPSRITNSLAFAV